MLTQSTIFDGTVTLKECRNAIKHRADTVDYISEYHAKISEILGIRYVYSFGSGRGALYVILKCMGIGQGDDVVIQGYTCVAVPKAVMYAGARPVYADISLNDYSMTLESMRKVITNNTRAVIVQHTYGIPCQEVYDIYKYCHEREIFVIEDCAHTFGGKYGDRLLGTIGDAAFFSTDHSKYISTSVGGIAVTDNEQLGVKIESFYNETDALTENEVNAVLDQLQDGIIWSNKYINRIVCMNKYIHKIVFYLKHIIMGEQRTYFLDDYDNYEWPDYTFPAKLSNVQAFLGVSQLERLQENYEHRKTITGIYDAALRKGFANVIDCKAPLMYPLLVNDPDYCAKKMKGTVEISRWFKNEILCITEEEYPNVFFDPSNCPNASYISKKIVNLPNHPKISVMEAKKICLKIKKIAL